LEKNNRAQTLDTFFKNLEPEAKKQKVGDKGSEKENKKE